MRPKHVLKLMRLLLRLENNDKFSSYITISNEDDCQRADLLCQNSIYRIKLGLLIDVLFL